MPRHSLGVEKSEIFHAGCEKLVVAVDHKPLLGILNDKDLESIDNGRLVKLKEKTMSYKFKLVHVPGIRHKVADATSRYPTGAMGNKQDRLTRTLVRYGRNEATDSYSNISNEIEQELESEINGYCMAIVGVKDCEAVGIEDVERESTRRGDTNQGSDWQENLNSYKQASRILHERNGIVLYGNRIVIPTKLGPKLLEILH